MLTALAIVLGLFMILAIAGTFAGLLRGETFSLLMLVVYAQAWFEILGHCVVVAGQGIVSAVSGD